MCRVNRYELEGEGKNMMAAEEEEEEEEEEKADTIPDGPISKFF